MGNKSMEAFAEWRKEIVRVQNVLKAKGFVEGTEDYRRAYEIEWKFQQKFGPSFIVQD